MALRHDVGRQIRNNARNVDYSPSYIIDHLSAHPTNREEHDSIHNRRRYQNFIANYSKGMHHNPENNANAGEVVVGDYQALLTAVKSGKPVDFENIPRGCANNDPCCRRYTNPQSGLALDLEGADSHSYVIPAPPSFIEQLSSFIQPVGLS